MSQVWCFAVALVAPHPDGSARYSRGTIYLWLRAWRRGPGGAVARAGGPCRDGTRPGRRAAAGLPGRSAAQIAEFAVIVPACWPVSRRSPVGDLGAQLRVVANELAADPGAAGELADAGRLAVGGHRVEYGADPRRLGLGVSPAQPGEVIGGLRHDGILRRRVRWQGTGGGWPGGPGRGTGPGMSCQGRPGCAGRGDGLLDATAVLVAEHGKHLLVGEDELTQGLDLLRGRRGAGPGPLGELRRGGGEAFGVGEQPDEVGVQLRLVGRVGSIRSPGGGTGTGRTAR